MYDICLSTHVGFYRYEGLRLLSLPGNREILSSAGCIRRHATKRLIGRGEIPGVWTSWGFHRHPKINLTRLQVIAHPPGPISGDNVNSETERPGLANGRLWMDLSTDA